MTAERAGGVPQDGGASGRPEPARQPPGAPAAVLVVCTANRCRSPMAQHLLQRAAVTRGLPLTVTSAGLLAAGRPAEPRAVDLMADRGLDLTGHRSRTVTPDLLRHADLVLTMERRHVQVTAELAPDTWTRTFTIREFVRRAAERGGRRSDESFERWVARVHAGRRPTDLLRGPADGDVDDPVGGSDREYAACAGELSSLVDQLVHLVSGDAPAELEPVSSPPGRSRTRRTFHRRR